MFDLKTLRLISMLSFACFTFVIFFLWRLVPQERGLRDFALTSMAIVVGLLLLGLYGIIPDFFSLAIGNALLALGFGLLYVGTRNLLGFGPGFGWHWLAAASAFFLCLLASSVTVRVVGTSALYVPFFSACAWLFWSSKREPGLQVTKRIAALIFAVGAMLFFFRALMPPPSSLTTADFVNSASGIQVAPYIYAIVFSMWLPITLLLIVSVRLQNQRVELLAKDESTIRKLQESEERYRTLIDWSPNAVAVHRNGALLYVNPATIKMFGASSAKDLIGKRILDFIHPDFHQAVTDRIKTGTTVGFDASSTGEKFLRLDGTTIEVEVQSTSILYEGEPAVHTALRDVTARVQAEAELRIAAVAIESEYGMIVTDANKVILRVNRAFTRITGYTAEEAIGKNPRLLSSGRHDANFYTAMWDVINRTGAWHGEIWNRRKNGEIYPEQLAITSVAGSAEKITHYVATLHDITKRKYIENKLERSETTLRMLFKLSPVGMAMVDHATGKFLEANDSLLHATGYTAAEFLTLDYWEITPRDYEAQELEQIRQLNETGRFGPNEKEYIRKDGSRYPISISGAIFTDEDGKSVVWGVIEDISERKKTEQQIFQLAFYDPLTQLPNRRLFNDRLTQTLMRAKREQSRMAVMFIDLDKFKPINDTHGHEAGDWVLEAVARRLESCLRASDTAARIGGDEFLVLLPDVQTCDDALAVAEKIRHEMQQPFITPSQLVLRATSSIGIAIYPDHANTEHDLLRLGDRAMYQAKNLGGNNVQMCDLSTEPEDTDDLKAAGQSIVRLTWKAAFAYGQPTIDKEHRELFHLSNILLDKVTTRAEEPAQFDAAFNALLAHMVEHFAHEEAILLAHGYEHLEVHTTIHQELVAQALKLRHPPHQQAGVSVGELVDFLVTEVVARHMLIEDQKFAHLFSDDNVRLNGTSSP